jgi:hypothetical protein
LSEMIHPIAALLVIVIKETCVAVKLEIEVTAQKIWAKTPFPCNSSAQSQPTLQTLFNFFLAL